jgi:hypothetical protein
MAVASPDEESTVTTAALLLLHEPPAIPPLNVVTSARHSCVVEITGTALTVTGFATLQPAGVVYLTDAVPADTPDTTPDEAPMPTTLPLEELHVPPKVASVCVIVFPAQSTDTPDIAAGNAFTVAISASKHPVGS